MLIAVWIVSGLLALAFLAAGIMKVARPHAKTVEGMPWAEDFPAPAVRTIGILEILGAIGLILPALTGILPILTPIAAVGLALIQVGAIVVHVRRKEYKVIPGNLVLLALALFVAIARFAGV
jgi:uncharacterized membrane protein YphA (DoxX/SURF4 family)